MTKQPYCNTCQRELKSSQVRTVKTFKTTCNSCGTITNQGDELSCINFESTNMQEVADVQYALSIYCKAKELTLEEADHSNFVIWTFVNSEGVSCYFRYFRKFPGFVEVGIKSLSLPDGLMNDREAVQRIGDSVGLQSQIRREYDLLNDAVESAWFGYDVLATSQIRPALIDSTLRRIEALMNQVMREAASL